MPSVVTEHSIIVASQDQVARELEGEVILLNLDEGVYYGLDTIGTRIWYLLQHPQAVHVIRDTLLEEYDVEPERCERDLLELLRQLATAGLIEVKNEADA